MQTVVRFGAPTVCAVSFRRSMVGSSKIRVVSVRFVAKPHHVGGPTYPRYLEQ